MGTLYPLKTNASSTSGLSSPATSGFSARIILLWCLPALLVGLALRVVLTVHMPMAFVSPDTNEFFSSKLFGGSRTFLPKLIYETPGFLGLPFLSCIAVFQHLLGMGLIVASGFLCANWLRAWRWWIIPFTLIMAVHPTLLWYEHFALPDSTFTFLLLLACLAGTRLYRHPGATSFTVLFAVLLLVAGARQEGFLFLAFGVALSVRAFWNDRRKLPIFALLALVLTAVFTLMTRTNQGGYMLLTSLIGWAPDQIKAEPGLSPRIVELRDHFQPRWPLFPEDHNDSRKMIIGKIEDYFARERGIPDKQLRAHTETLSRQLAFEIAAGNFWRLPGLMFNKFRASHIEEPAPDFGATWAHAKHLRIFFGDLDDTKPPKENRMMKLFLGREYRSRAEMEQDLPRLYHVLPGDWLSRYQRVFYDLEYWGTALPEHVVPPQKLPALPLLYPLALAGFLAVMFRDGFRITERQLWIATLALQFCVIFLTGSLRSRYRLSFEPWFFLGLFALFDSAFGLAKAAFTRKSPNQDTRPAGSAGSSTSF